VLHCERFVYNCKEMSLQPVLHLCNMFILCRPTVSRLEGRFMYYAYCLTVGSAVPWTRGLTPGSRIVPLETVIVAQRFVLLCSQESIIGSYPAADESSPNPPILFLQDPF
jgi:hypothetical protein